MKLKINEPVTTIFEPEYAVLGNGDMVVAVFKNVFGASLYLENAKKEWPNNSYRMVNVTETE